MPKPKFVREVLAELTSDKLFDGIRYVNDGISALTSERNVGDPDDPLGEAKIRFADCELSVAPSVPEVVTGDPDTVKIDGIVRPTFDTVPLPPDDVVSTIISPEPEELRTSVPAGNPRDSVCPVCTWALQIDEARNNMKKIYFNKVFPDKHHSRNIAFL